MKFTFVIAGFLSLITFADATACSDYQIVDRDPSAYCDDGGECCFTAGGCNEGGIVYSHGSCPVSFTNTS